jgi:hypothetical protein
VKRSQTLVCVSIYLLKAKRGKNTMNFKTSVIFGIVFTFSFCAVEAMAKCTSVEAGKFCKETMKLNCRGGCYCLGSSSGTSVSAAGSVNVASVCNEEYTDSGTLPSGTSQW